MESKKFSWLTEKHLLYPRWVKWGIQVLYWFLHISFHISFYAELDGNEPSTVITWSLVTMGSAISIFYIYFYYLIPKVLGKNNLKFVIVTVLIVIGYPFLKYQLDQLLGLPSLKTLQLSIGEEITDARRLGQEYGRRLFTLFWVIPFALFTRFMVDWFKNKRIKSIMETQQLKSELAMLRNQVNPHFLFNVLNNIDAMVYPHSEEASEAIMKLSSIMRYMLYESDTEFVNIDKEIVYIKAFVDLQRMRLKPTDEVVFEANNLKSDFKIAPMILIPFVENAFKHASRIDNQLMIHIRLTVEADQMHFNIKNSFDPHTVEEKDETGGIGLSNVKKRLSLIYQHQYQLEISQDEGVYAVDLSIKSENP